MKMSSYFLFDYIVDFSAPPPKKKISNNILIYLTSYKTFGAPPPFPVIKIVRYCGVWEGGGGGAKIPQRIMASPFFDIKIVKYCGVKEGGGRIGGRQNPTKDNGADWRPLSLTLR